MAIQAQVYNSENIVGFPLCGSSSSNNNINQDWMMMMMMENAASSGGLNQFGFNTQQQKQQQQQIHRFQHNQNQSLFFENSASASSLKNNNQENCYHLSMPVSVQVEKQRQEIDHYIRLQNEKLRLVLQEQKRQQLEMLMKKIESKAATLLRQKDEEIAKANNRTVELEILLKRLEMENQAWQRMAMEYESMVFSLNTTLEQMREKAPTASCCFFNNGGGGAAAAAEDAESCCDVGEQQQQQHEEEAEEKTEENRAKNLMMICKSCNSGDACVLFLPCRHLCACKACEAFLDSCPVCLAPKKASIEALIT